MFSTRIQQGGHEWVRKRLKTSFCTVFSMQHATMESNADLPAPLNAIAKGDEPKATTGDGTSWRREWRKYCCRLYYDKNRDAILTKRLHH